MEAILLTQEDCAYCDQAKSLLATLSAEYGFEVQLLDMRTAEGQRLAEHGGVMFPPGILIDGEAISYGRPSERRLRRELDRRTRSRTSG